MTPVATSSFLDFWSPTSIIAGVDRLADRAPAIGQTSSAGQTEAAFEQALVDELAKDRSAHPVDISQAQQHRAQFDETFEARSGPIRDDSSKTIARGPAEDPLAAGADRHVHFEANAGQTRKPGGGGGDDAGMGFQPGDQGAFWLGDRFAEVKASSAEVPGGQSRLPVDADVAHKVLFNGDGRPIVLSSIDDLQPPTSGTEDAWSGGDLMILPDGAVVDYGPWTVDALA